LRDRIVGVAIVSSNLRSYRDRIVEVKSAREITFVRSSTAFPKSGFTLSSRNVSDKAPASGRYRTAPSTKETIMKTLIGALVFASTACALAASANARLVQVTATEF